MHALHKLPVCVGECIEDVSDLVGTTRDVVIGSVWVLNGEIV